MHRFYVILDHPQENFIHRESPRGKKGNELVMRARMLSTHELGPCLCSVYTLMHFSSSNDPVHHHHHFIVGEDEMQGDRSGYSALREPTSDTPDLNPELHSLKQTSSRSPHLGGG